MSHYKAAAAILTNAITAINTILTGPDDELHRIKLAQSLQREADYLLLITGAGDLTENTATTLGPAKTIGGKPIGKLPRITERELRPSDDAVLDLKDQVESALVYFGPNSNAAGILANMPDLVIRGVAKKAGLQVTKDNPKELTVEFIDKIKAALLEKGLVETEPMKPNNPVTDEDIAALAQKIKEAAGEGDDAGGKLTPILGQGGLSEVHTVSSADLNTWAGKQTATETPAETPAPAEPAPVDMVAKGIHPKDESKKKSVGK